MTDLVSNKTSKLLTGFDIFLDRCGNKLVELLNRLWNWLRGGLRGGGGLRRRRRGRGIGIGRRRGNGLIESGNCLGKLDGRGGDIFEPSRSSFEPCLEVSCECADRGCHNRSNSELKPVNVAVELDAKQSRLIGFQSTYRLMRVVRLCMLFVAMLGRGGEPKLVARRRSTGEIIGRRRWAGGKH